LFNNTIQNETSPSTSNQPSNETQSPQLTNATSNNDTNKNATGLLNETSLAFTNQTSNETQTPANITTEKPSVLGELEPNNYFNANFTKIQPSFIPEIIQANATCFQKLLPVIAYLSDYEQAILVKASIKNKEENRCIDCQYYIDNFLKILKKDLASIVTLLNVESFSKREPLKCFLNQVSKAEGNSFSQNQAQNSSENINQTNLNNQQNSIIDQIQELISDYLYFQALSNKCTANFVKDLGYLLAQRRRFFCAKNEDIQKMGITDENNNIISFKWTSKEAEQITDLFNNFAQCKSLENIIYPQTFNKANSILTKSGNCKIENQNLLKSSSSGNQTDNRTLLEKTTSKAKIRRSLFSSGKSIQIL